MNKYEELINTFESTQIFHDAIGTNFNETFCKGFAAFLGCSPAMILSEMTNLPRLTREDTFCEYTFTVSLNIISKDVTKMTLNLPLNISVFTDETDPDEMKIKFANRKHNTLEFVEDDISYRLDHEFYEVLYQVFKEEIL